MLFACFSVAAAGAHGLAALRHLRLLARTLAQGLGEDEGSSAAATALTQRWDAELSVALQAATARQLLTEVGKFCSDPCDAGMKSVIFLVSNWTPLGCHGDIERAKTIRWPSEQRGCSA